MSELIILGKILPICAELEPISLVWLLGSKKIKNKQETIVYLVFSSPVQKYRKSYCTIPGVDFGIGGINKNVSVMSRILRP